MHGLKPYEFVVKMSTHAPKPYELIGKMATHSSKPYEFVGLRAMAGLFVPSISNVLEAALTSTGRSLASSARPGLRSFERGSGLGARKCLMLPMNS